LCVIRYVESLREEATRKLLSQYPSNDDLQYVIRNIKLLQEDAARKLLSQHPSKGDLRCVIEHVPSLREDARRMFTLAAQRANVVRDLIRKRKE
jgi:hypothetical protein